jgi:hypothetical protein
MPRTKPTPRTPHTLAIAPPLHCYPAWEFHTLLKTEASPNGHLTKRVRELADPSTTTHAHEVWDATLRFMYALAYSRTVTTAPAGVDIIARQILALHATLIKHSAPVNLQQLSERWLESINESKQRVSAEEKEYKAWLSQEGLA